MKCKQGIRPPWPRRRLGLLMASALVGGQGQAADSSGQPIERLERMVVTGSNIKRLAGEGAQVVQIITAAEIQRMGIQSAGELLDSITSNGDGKISEVNTNTFTPGASGASLRGLGANASLVLLNGRRVAYYGFVSTSTFVDLYSIPWAALERVEILKEGASAIYGTDAIGGVINFVLKRDFKGAEVAVSAGRSLTFKDMDYRSASLITGKTEGKLNLLAAFDHYQRDGVMQSARPVMYADQTEQALAVGYQPADIGYISQKWGDSTPAFNRLVSYANTGNKWNGSSYQSTGACNLGSDKLNAAGTCMHSYSDDMSYMPSQKRSSGFARLNWDFAESSSLFAEASLSRSEMEMDYIPTSTYTLNNNYFLAGQWGNSASTPVYFRRLFWEMGPRRRVTQSDSYRFLIGLRGDHQGWDWESALGIARTDTSIVGTGYLNIAEAKKRIGSMDVFKALSPEDAAAISGESNRAGDSQFLFVDARASRELAKLPAGPLMMALGADLRHEEMSDGTDERTNAGEILGGGVRRPISGQRSQSALYGELSVPVLSGLDLQLALRSDRYQGFGSTTNPKVAFKWMPDKRFMARGSYSTGFRAPSVPELRGEYEYWSTDSNNQTIKIRVDNAPELGPERSKNINLGLGFEPAPGWLIGLDAWLVHRNNEVYFPGPPELPLSIIDKGPEGVPIWIYRPYNAGETKVQGVDIDLRGRIKLDNWGQISLSSVSTYLDRVLRVNAQGEPQEVAGEWGNPRWRNSSSAWWSMGSWGAGLSLNFRGKFKAYYQVRDESLYLPAFSTLDMSMSYSGFKGIKLSGGINNIAGKRPPFELNYAQSGANYLDNLNGRRLWLRAGYSFH